MTNNVRRGLGIALIGALTYFLAFAIAAAAGFEAEGTTEGVVTVFTAIGVVAVVWGLGRVAWGLLRD